MLLALALLTWLSRGVSTGSSNGSWGWFSTLIEGKILLFRLISSSLLFAGTR